jgi:hypothetical protein
MKCRQFQLLNSKDMPTSSSDPPFRMILNELDFW